MKLPKLSRGSRGLLTLTVEHGALKFLVTRGTQVLDFRLLPINPAFFREGLIGRPDQVAQSITVALRDLKADYGRIIAAVPGYQTSLRIVDLPVAPGLDPRVALPREAARIMGIPLSQSLLRWYRLPDSPGLSRWLVVVVGRRSVEALLDTVRAARLRLDAVEPRPFALARYANLRDVIIAWAGTDGVDVMVVRRFVPVVYGSLSWERESIGEVIVERISQMMEQMLRGAEGYLPAGWLPEDAPLCVLGISPGVSGLVGPGVAANLGRKLVEVRPPVQAPEDFPWQELAVNVGLALREA